MKVGDKVKWTSQSKGYVRTKEGWICASVPANVHPQNRLPVDHNFRGIPGGMRDHESYLVKVGKSKRLYWPLVSKLEVIL